MSIENIILSSLLYNEDYVRKTIAFLKPEYFHNDADKVLYKLIEHYFQKYNASPTKEALLLDIDKVSLPEHVFKECVEKTKTLEYTEQQMVWLTDTTEKFCQDKALYNAIMDSIKIIDDDDDKNPLSKGSIPQILSDALAVSFDTDIGHDYLENSEERFEYYHLAEAKIPFDIEHFNNITKGGVSRKTLTIILAGIGAGKSLAMCHMAAGNLVDNKNVLYITLEMAEEKIAERIDANLLNITMDDLDKTPKAYYDKMIAKLKSRTMGKLIIKEYPTSTAHANHFRHLLNELKIKKNFIPDIIYIDYINLCGSVRIKAGANANSYTMIKSIAEELRGLAVEHNVPIISATQVTRAGYGSSDIEITDTSECIFEDEMIELRDGSSKMIKEIVVGDQIVSNDEYKTVHMVHHSKLKDCYKIKTSAGKEIIVSKDHVFPTKRGRISIETGLSVGDNLNSRNRDE